MLFLRRLMSERGQCAKTVRILGWTASRRAGRERAGTLVVSREFLIDVGFGDICGCVQHESFVNSFPNSAVIAE